MDYREENKGGGMAAFVLITAAAGCALQLGPGEEAYLRALEPASVCVDPDWEPFERIDQDGAYVGIAADLIRLIGEKTGASFHVASTLGRDEISMPIVVTSRGLMLYDGLSHIIQ